MPTIAKFDRESLKQVQDTIISAFSQLNTGVQLKFRGGRFTGNLATLKLECFLPSANGEPVEVAVFNKCRALHGLSTTDLGKKFSCNGVLYTFKGMRDCRSKYKFYGDTISGKRMLFTRDTLRFIEPAPAN